MPITPKAEDQRWPDRPTAVTAIGVWASIGGRRVQIVKNKSKRDR